MAAAVSVVLVVIVGAGLSGAVIAERASKVLGLKVNLLQRSDNHLILSFCL